MRVLWTVGVSLVVLGWALTQVGTLRTTSPVNRLTSDAKELVAALIIYDQHHQGRPQAIEELFYTYDEDLTDNSFANQSARQRLQFKMTFSPNPTSDMVILQFTFDNRTIAIFGDGHVADIIP